MTASQIQKIKDDAVKEATDVSFILMLSLPTMVLHDHFGKLMKKEGRGNTFIDLTLDIYDSFEKGYITLNDCIETVKRESGTIINLERLRMRQNKWIQKE